MIVSPSPPCRRCGSYMVFPRERDGLKYKVCKNCGKIKYQKSFLRRMICKFLKERKVIVEKLYQLLPMKKV